MKETTRFLSIFKKKVRGLFPSICICGNTSLEDFPWLIYKNRFCTYITNFIIAQEFINSI